MRQRSDAERNDRAVLAAAIDLHAESRSGTPISVDAVAARAGVGKGTVFRAFGDKAGLLRAAMAACAEPVMSQLDQRGDGDPADLLVSTVEALLDLKVRHRQLALALEELGAASPFDATHYAWWFDHVRTHLVAIGAESADFTAHLVLGSVRSDLVEHLLGSGGWTHEQLREAVRRTTLQLITHPA